MTGLFANPAHLLETALLLLVAFLIGATSGHLLRRLLAPRRKAKPASPIVASRIAKVTGAPALVTSPSIEPLSAPPKPQAPEIVPEPDFSEALNALAEAGVLGAPRQIEVKTGEAPALPEIMPPKPASTLPEVETMLSQIGRPPIGPAHVAGETVSGRHLEWGGAEPEAELVPEAPELADLVEAASADATVWELPGGDTLTLPTESEPEALPPSVATLEIDWSEPPTPYRLPEIEPVATDEPPAVAAEVPTISDEDAAMRAIEGNWSPRGRPKFDAALSAEGAVAASAAAVAAATAAAEAVLAEAGVVFELPGRPELYAAPPDHGGDELTRIAGVDADLAARLQALGVYDFSQIAGWSAENVAWLEAELAIEGRIGAEGWQHQAAALAAEGAPPHAEVAE